MAAFVRPDLLTIHFAHPYPGTRYFDQVREHRIPLDSLHAQSEPALNLPGLPAETLQRAARRMLRRHYTRPTTLASLARKGIATIADRAFA